MRLTQPAIDGVPCMSYGMVVCCLESHSANQFEHDTGMMVLEPDASSSMSNGRNLLVPDYLEGPGAPELLSYTVCFVIECGILLDS